MMTPLKNTIEIIKLGQPETSYPHCKERNKIQAAPNMA